MCLESNHTCTFLSMSNTLAGSRDDFRGVMSQYLCYVSLFKHEPAKMELLRQNSTLNSSQILGNRWRIYCRCRIRGRAIRLAEIIVYDATRTSLANFDRLRVN